MKPIEKRIRQIAGGLVAVKVTRKRSRSGYEVVSPNGNVIHSCPSMDEALASLIAWIRTEDKRTYEIRPLKSEPVRDEAKEEETPYLDEMLEWFRRYEEVRASGRFNMFDPRAVTASGLTSDQFRFVMDHYSGLMEIARERGIK